MDNVDPDLFNFFIFMGDDLDAVPVVPKEGGNEADTDKELDGAELESGVFRPDSGQGAAVPLLVVRYSSAVRDVQDEAFADTQKLPESARPLNVVRGAPVDDEPLSDDELFHVSQADLEAWSAENLPAANATTVELVVRTVEGVQQSVRLEIVAGEMLPSGDPEKWPEDGLQEGVHYQVLPGDPAENMRKLLGISDEPVGLASLANIPPIRVGFEGPLDQLPPGAEPGAGLRRAILFPKVFDGSKWLRNFLLSFFKKD